MATAQSTVGELRLDDVPFTPASETIRRGSRLISSKVGLIQAIAHGEYRAQDPVTFALGSRVADLSRVSEIVSFNKAGGGGENLEDALAATIGEAAERYCTLVYDRDEMVLAAWRDVREMAPDPDLLRLFSREQVDAGKIHPKLVWFDEDTRLRWVWSYSLTARRPRLLPAPLVYLSYRAGDDEGFTGRNASSGLAAGATLEEAILSGLYEVIERDAFTLAWMRRYAGRRVLIDDPALRIDMERRFHTNNRNVSLEVFDITPEFPVPSVFALLRRPSEFGPVLCVSSVTRLNPAQLIAKTLREIGQGLPYFRYLRPKLQDWHPRDDFADISTFDHHCMLYFKRPELVAPALAFCGAVRDQVKLTEYPDHSTGRVRRDIEFCIDALGRSGFEVIVADITTPEIRHVGLRVVRVVVPGLVNLHGDHATPYLGCVRLHSGPYERKWSEAGWTKPDGFNPFPHPFP